MIDESSFVHEEEYMLSNDHSLWLLTLFAQTDGGQLYSVQTVQGLPAARDYKH